MCTFIWLWTCYVTLKDTLFLTTDIYIYILDRRHSYNDVFKRKWIQKKNTLFPWQTSLILLIYVNEVNFGIDICLSSSDLEMVHTCVAWIEMSFLIHLKTWHLLDCSYWYLVFAKWYTCTVVSLLNILLWTDYFCLSINVIMSLFVS